LGPYPVSSNIDFQRIDIGNNWVFDRESIRKQKGTVKEKNRGEDKEGKGDFLKKTGLCGA
jgi:hypothetical protein